MELVKENRLHYYTPYPWQARFHEDRNPQVALMAANRVGKTFSGAMQMAFHLTGDYPGWWTGRRFHKPIKAWVGGTTAEKTRDICQTALIGPPEDKNQWGTGTVPKNTLGKLTKRPGYPNAIQSIQIRHKSGGWSRLAFKAYEAGAEAWMGESVDLIWLDEEPPQNIYTQAITRTLDKSGQTYMTFTPESGVTEVVSSFMNNLQEGQSLHHAAWDDAPHLSEDAKEQILSALPLHEREMRSKGIPILGSGLIFPVPEDEITIDPIPIPNSWARIVGLDFGWDHPTAAVWMAHDRDSDIIYVYDVYKERQQTPIIHAAAINARGKWIPVAWPKDGLNADKGSGKQLSQLYKDQGVNMLRDFFQNPPIDGKSDAYVEPGLLAMLQRMQTGRFKVFSHLVEWFREFKIYHRRQLPNGKVEIVKKSDDLMSATRYGAQSLRFAKTEGEKKVWKDLKYQRKGIV